MANSSYFGMQNKIDSIGHALMILGLQNIKNILYREGMLQMFQTASPKQKGENGISVETCQIPDDCAEILEKALAKNRDERYQQGRELINDLAKCRAGLKQ